MENTWFSNYPWKDENGVKRDLEFYRNLPADVRQYDWQDEIFRTAFSHNHYASLTGGKEGTRYSTSLSYMNQEGVIEIQTLNVIKVASALTSALTTSSKST